MSENQHPFIERIKDAISQHIDSERADEFPFRHHLGASVLSHTCERFLFYTFRWFMVPQHPSRVVRIFNRGHREEDRMIGTLRDIGLVISTTYEELFKNLNVPVSYESIAALKDYGINLHAPFAHKYGEHKQLQVDMPSHLGGSIDGVLHVPAEYVDELGYLLPIECKTHNRKNYMAAMNKNLIESQPKHYAQINTYGKYLGAKYGLYYAENKDNEEINFKLVKLDASLVDLYERRGLNVIYTQDPKQLSRTTETWMCKMCDYAPLCKKNLPPTSISCRSCANFFPQKDGSWLCMARSDVVVEKYKEIEIAEQCPQYKGLK